jgi:hypothetical protein
MKYTDINVKNNTTKAKLKKSSQDPRNYKMIKITLEFPVFDTFDNFSIGAHLQTLANSFEMNDFEDAGKFSAQSAPVTKKDLEDFVKTVGEWWVMNNDSDYEDFDIPLHAVVKTMK